MGDGLKTNIIAYTNILIFYYALSNGQEKGAGQKASQKLPC